MKTDQAPKTPRRKAVVQELADVPMASLCAEMGISRARLAQIEAQALKKLRAELLRRGYRLEWLL